jgi:hypothetical protein
MAAYDPNGAGTVTALAGTEAAVHRLYMLGDQFIWAYGQSKYTNFADALLRLNIDRSTYQPSTRLSAATLICEIIAQFNSTSVNDGGVTSAIISSSSQQYLFGSANSINDAPTGGLTYGRRGSDSTWQPVANATNPIYPGDVTITKSSPRLIEKFNPIAAGWAGLEVQQDLGFDWFTIEATYPDDKVYFRSYNTATGALRASTTFDLATGLWAFPAGSTVGGLAIGDGDVHGPASSADNQIALYGGTTGKTIKAGVVVGDVVGHDIQPTPTDITAGGVLTVGSFGLGTAGALNMPIGTTLQRPLVTIDGQTRINTTTNSLEYYYNSMWNSVPKLPAGYINGLVLGFQSGTLNVFPGSCTSFDGTTACVLSSAIGKNLGPVWVEGGTPGATLGGRAAAVPWVASAWYRVFLISKSDGTSDVGFDTSATALNLLATAASAGYTKYRRIGWVQAGLISGSIATFSVVNNKYSRPGSALATSSTLSTSPTAYNAIGLPLNVIGIFGVILDGSGAGVRYANMNPLVTANQLNFDVSANGSPVSATVEVKIGNTNAVNVYFSGGNIIWSMNQMGWIDDTSNLFNL